MQAEAALVGVVAEALVGVVAEALVGAAAALALAAALVVAALVVVALAVVALALALAVELAPVVALAPVVELALVVELAPVVELALELALELELELELGLVPVAAPVLAVARALAAVPAVVAAPAAAAVPAVVAAPVVAAAPAVARAAAVVARAAAVVARAAAVVPAAVQADDHSRASTCPKEVNMSTDNAIAVWPESASQADAYVQVGDVVSLMLNRKGVAFGTCEFCQTVNHGGALRCRTCGGTLTSSHEEEDAAAPVDRPEQATPRERRELSDARALCSALRLVLVPSLLLFTAFASWHQIRTAAKPPQTSATVTLQGSPNAWSQPANGLAARDRHTMGRAASSPSRLQPIAHESSESKAGAALPTTSKSPSSRPKPISSTSSSRGERDSLAACSGRHFIARAVCVNTQCAEPGMGQLPQCKEALRQRRIDESRRNPTLMG